MAPRAKETGPPRLKGAEWLERPATQAVFTALRAGGYEGRAVGGAVRNALLGTPVKDTDIATTALPEEVMRLATAAGLKAIPTGLEHGTVTVVSSHVAYEVTTLRKDIETFGRHARVTFTADWAEDARRRDFTMNALYCGADGTVHDPLGGWPDLVARRVRFIGEARERIREDYLRILRFFRFTAEYAAGVPDAEGLAACLAERAGLELLSGERIRAELLRLLTASAAIPAVRVMAEHGLLQDLIGAEPDVDALSRLAEIEQALGRAPDAILRLAALAVREPDDAARLKDRLRLSGAEHDRLARATPYALALNPQVPDEAVKPLLYRIRADAFRDATLLAWAHSSDATDSARWRRRLELPDRWPPPALPFRGADLITLGVPPGPEVGRTLAEFEAWWMGEGFPADRDRLEAKLREIAAPHVK